MTDGCASEATGMADDEGCTVVALPSAVREMSSTQDGLVGEAHGQQEKQLRCLRLAVHVNR